MSHTPDRSAGETERIRRIYERDASRFDRQIRLFEKVLFGDGRQWACSQARGQVLEVAVGTGRNLPFYPPHANLTGIELSPAMLAIARARARELGQEVDLREGDAQSLEFADESFDTVVCTLSLCCIPDERKAVAEMHRVLRPSGLLLLVDHIRSSVRPVLWIQRLLEPLVFRFEGDYLTRRPLEAVSDEGFVVERRERMKWGIVERVRASKPGPAGSPGPVISPR
jgi:ubiquinone/menaquinone biosynthesis C-methylase UbiE